EGSQRDPLVEGGVVGVEDAIEEDAAGPLGAADVLSVDGRGGVGHWMSPNRSCNVLVNWRVSALRGPPIGAVSSARRSATTAMAGSTVSTPLGVRASCTARGSAGLVVRSIRPWCSRARASLET